LLKMYKNKKLILTIFVGLLIIIGLSWLARPTSTNQKADLGEKTDIGIEVDNKDYDFGTISMAEGVVTHKFKVKNSSEFPLQINKMYTSCMCTVASLLLKESKFGPMGMPGHGSIPEFKAELQPGEEAEVEVAFDPAAHGPAGVGRIARSVFLESNGQTVLELGIAAFVRP